MQFSNDGSSWSSAENFAATKEWDVTAGDGQKQVYVKYLDAAGNWSEAFSSAIILDTIPPSVMSAPGGGLYNTPQSVTLTASEAAAIYYTTDGTTPSTASASYNQPVSISATATLSFFARDPAGNGSPVKSESYTIDTTPPVVKITSHASGQYLNTPGITLGGTLDDPSAMVTVNGQPATVNGSTFTSTLSLTEGPNTITVVATDPAVNSGTDSIVLNLDTIYPQLTVSTLSDGSYTNSETVNISGTVTDAGGLDKHLINGAVVSVNADGSYSHALILQAGANAITVEAVDKAANKSSSSRTINLDQAAPQLTITAPADNSKTGVRLVEITGTVDEQVSSLTVNGQPVTVNGLAFTATVIPEYGYNTIEITARDWAENPGTQKRTVIFDDKKPAVAITEPAQDLRTNISSLTLKGTASDADGLTAVGVTVTMDGATFTPAVVSGAFEQALTFGEEKSYAIIVTAKDEVGNETSVQRNVIYDITPPAVTVNPFDSPVNQESQVISGTREAGVAITISSATAVIGAITYGSDTTWQATVTGLVADKNDIVVTAADLAGNHGNTATQIIYDTTPPVITVTAPLAEAFLNTPQITVTGTVSEPVTSVKVNGVAATVSGLNFTLPITLVEGVNSLAIRALDRAGNEGVATLQVNLDTVPPVLTIATPASGLLTKSPQVTVSGTVSEESTAVTVSGQQATVNSLTFTSTLTLAEGLNTLSVTAVDRAGNSGTAAVTVNLDSTTPAAPVLATQKTPTNVAVVAVGGTAEAGSNVKISSAGALLGTVSADAQGNFQLPDVTLADGSNSFTAVATDAAGNDSSQSEPLSVVLDTVKPVIAVTAPQVGAIISTSEVAINGTVSEPLTSLTINGGSTPLTGLAFEQSMSLAAGDNSALITAVDLAGNVATVTLTIQRDSTPPVVTITAPQAGLLTRNSALQVSGTVDDAEATLTVNTSTPLSAGSITVNDGAFNFTYTLSEGDNSINVEATDKAGNKGSASTTVALDATAPQITVSAPATATAGTDVQLVISASDNRNLTLAELRAGGVPVWSTSPANSATASETISYRLSPSLNAGAEVILQARAVDVAGNEGISTAKIIISQAAADPGYVQGKVLDDIRGLRMEGATVTVSDSKGETKTATTGTDGGYFMETAAGDALVRITRPGYTAIERRISVRPQQKTTTRDARLAPVSSQINLLDANGGKIKVSVGADLVSAQGSTSVPSLELAVPANALSTSADLRITPISNQGLAGLLPPGWSPLAAADLRLLDPATAAPLSEPVFASPANMKISMPAMPGLADATITLVKYDEAAHQWIAQGTATIAADGTSATADIPATGQYAIVVPDSLPNAPTAAQAGAFLAAATTIVLDYATVTATGKVVPQAAPPSTGLKAAGEVVVVAKEGASPVFTSGLLLNSQITEKFDLKSGDKVENPAYTQDIVLYRAPCITNIGGGAVSSVETASTLRTTFPVAPSKDYTIVDLLLGKVGVEITPPASADNGVMVTADGGRILDADGNVLLIPPGALSQTTPVATKSVTATAAIGADFTLIKAVEVNLTRQTLATSATLSIPAPDGFNPSLQLIVAKEITVKGITKLKLVALAKQAGSFITSDISATGIALSGITTTGTYYFLQAREQLGFVAGTVTDAANSAYIGALVKTEKGSLVDLVASNGKYLLAAPVATFIATALDLYKNDEVSANSAITAVNQIVNLDLKIEKIPPAVVSVSPANGAVKVQPDVPVVVTFSKPMDKATITSATLVVRDAANSTVSGALTFNIDNTVVTFYPSEAFKQEATYSVTIAASVKDVQGYLLGQEVVSNFTVRKTTPPPMPAAGSVSATFPDADGFITVTATQGSAEVGNTVLLINDTTGEITSVTPQSNGSFTGRTRAQLGDEIKVVIMDYSGNQTLVSYITFKSDDGRYLVTAKGGKVEGEGGSQLEIPEGALVGPTVIKVAALPEANLPSPLQTPGVFLAAFNIDTGGIPFKSEVKLSMPLPPGFNPATPVFVTRPSEVLNEDGTIEKVYEIIDSTKIVNNRITTASPPFDGVMGFGSYAFTAFPEVNVGIVDGYTYQEMNDQPGYQPTAGGLVEIPVKDAAGNLIYKFDKPVPRAVIRTPAAWNYVSYANSKGFYAGFATLYGNVGATDLEYKVTAIHPLTMQRQTITGYLNAFGNIKNLNFKLADKGTVLPDKTAPVIDVNMSLVPGQSADYRISAGTAIEGTKLSIPVAVIDEGMGNATLTVKYDTPDFTGSQLSSIPLTMVGQPKPQATKDKTQVYRYDYMPQFSQNYFIGAQSGLYTFIVEATDAAGNKSTKSTSIRIVPTGTNLGTSLDGPPTVDYVLPAAGAEDVQITSSISAIFSEPVDHVDTTTFKLIDKKTGQIVPATVYTTVEDGRIKGVLIPKSNLYYEREYEVRLTMGITDTSPNQSANNAILPLKDEYTGTFKTMLPHAYDLAADKFENARDIDVYTNLTTGRSYAYVAADTNGYRVVDVTDPTKPAVVYPTEFSLFAAKVMSFRGVAANQATGVLAMTENIAFPDGNQYGYVRFYDVAANPVDLRSAKVGQERLAEAYSGIPGRVALNSNYAYIATAGAGLQVVDIEAAKDYATKGAMSDGSTIAGAFDSIGQGFGSPNDIVLYGDNKGILTTNPGWLLPLEITIPGSKADASDVQPVVVTNTTSFKPEGHSFTRVAVASEYIYSDEVTGADKTIDLVIAGTGQGKLISIDITDPYTPQILGTATDEAGNTLSTYVMDVSVNKPEGLAYATTFNSIQVFDIKNPNKPKLIKTITQLTDNADNVVSLGSIPAIMERNGLVYVASKTEGIKVMDMVSPVLLNIVAKEQVPVTLTNYNSIFNMIMSSMVGSGDPTLDIVSDSVFSIRNNAGQPVMPGITLSLVARDDKGQIIDLSNNYVKWKTSVVYKVNIKDGYEYMASYKIPEIGFTDLLGPTYDINFGSNFGGGKITVEAQTIIKNKPYKKVFEGYIQGQTNKENPKQKNDTIAYLEAPLGYPNYLGLLNELGNNKAFRAIVHRETGGSYEHFEKLADKKMFRYADVFGYPATVSFPLMNKGVSKDKKTVFTDGGFGLMQLTDPVPDYDEVWSYRKNIDAGIKLIATKKAEALARLLKQHSLGTSPAEKQVLRMETYYGYGPHNNKNQNWLNFFMWNKKKERWEYSETDKVNKPYPLHIIEIEKIL